MKSQIAQLICVFLGRVEVQLNRQMPRVFVQYLQGQNIYVCSRCRSPLSSLGELVSKAFRGQHGTAYLFNSVINVTQGKADRKRLTTGLHTVCDIFCVVCGPREPVGWKYIAAEEEDQKYKQGRYILEEALIDKSEWNAD